MSHSFKSSQVLTLIAAVVASASGCVENSNGEGPQQFRIPWPDEAGVYSEQNVEIATFDHRESFSGKWARILVAPGATGGELVGGPAVGRYLRAEDGSLWPADLRTREATVIYAHFERLHAMDEEIGALSLSPWPATIGIRARLRGLPPEFSEDNAFFDCAYKGLVIVPYTTKLPVSMNAGVLAHEHAHASFCSVVLAPIAAQIGRFPSFSVGEADDLNGFILRGINEAYSDVRAWAYTGDPNFLSASLPRQSGRRRLDVAIAKVDSVDAWKTRLGQIREGETSAARADSLVLQSAYAMGTQIARSILKLAVASEGGAVPTRTTRMEVARASIGALPAIEHAARIAYAGGTNIEPQLGVSMFAQAYAEIRSCARGPVGSESKAKQCAR